MIRRDVIASLLMMPAASVSAQDFLTVKPIVQAVRNGDEDKVRQALLRNESANQLDSNGQPLLVVAVMAGHVGVVDALLKGGAIPDSADREGYTPLHRAAERGDVDIVEMLLRRNARTGTQTRQGATALIIASRLGFAEVVRALLDKKADPNIPDFTGRRALSYAKQAGRTPIEAMLRKAGGRE